MAFCSNCGQKLADGVKFCANCGAPAGGAVPQNDGSIRKQTFVGEIRKCPNCGAQVPGLTAKCPECGFELNNVQVANSLLDFTNRLMNTTDFKSKITIVSTYPVPNTKEDIIEFLIFAKSQLMSAVDRSAAETNAKLSAYQNMMGGFTSMFGIKKAEREYTQVDLDNAWVSKIKQCKDKADIAFAGDTELLTKINDLMPKPRTKNGFKLTFGKNEDL